MEGSEGYGDGNISNGDECNCYNRIREIKPVDVKIMEILDEIIIIKELEMEAIKKELGWNVNSANDLIRFPAIKIGKASNSGSKSKKKKRIGKARKTADAKEINKELVQEIVKKKTIHSKSTQRERLSDINPIALNNQIFSGTQPLKDQFQIQGILK